MDQNATARQGDGPERTKKRNPDKRMMDVKKRLQKGVHANTRGEMKTIHNLHGRISVICQNFEGIFPFFFREKTKTAVLRVFLFISMAVRQFMLDVCVFECV